MDKEDNPNLLNFEFWQMYRRYSHVWALGIFFPLVVGFIHFDKIFKLLFIYFIVIIFFLFSFGGGGC